MPEISTIATVDEAKAFLDKLAQDNDWVSVFWGRGWGDSGQKAEISVIVGGNGQDPKAYLTDEVYRSLLADEVIPPNSLKTFKARRLHDYKEPPPDPEPKVNPAKVAEQVIRSLLAGMADVPVRAEFYRGLDPNSRTPRVMHEVVTTPVCGREWFVRVLPGAFDVAVSAAGALFLGEADVIGKATCLVYPTAGPDDLDRAALEGPEFRAELERLIRAKYADVVAERDAAGSGGESQ